MHSEQKLEQNQHGTTFIVTPQKEICLYHVSQISNKTLVGITSFYSEKIPNNLYILPSLLVITVSQELYLWNVKTALQIVKINPLIQHLNYEIKGGEVNEWVL